jgi:S1-C subfamily serine protease
MQSSRDARRSIALVATLFAGGWFVAAAESQAAETKSASSLVNSVTIDDLRRHVQILADDTFEGREAGSRGGRAAAGYLGREFQKCKLAGGAGAGGYYQTFAGQYRNILGLLEGSDPLLKKEVIVVGAHYDHVGYGSAQNSYGPTGYIHNGADDNASGVAGLAEIVEAFSRLEPRPKRSILFAFWDGEEKGLLGSKHWVSQPTLPLARVRLMLNLDMIGRLRNDYVEIYGSRTGSDLRRLACLQNRDSNLRLDFSWKMRDDSDHYSFYQKGIPVLFVHSGLHDDYHRPSDDAEKLNLAGMQRIVQWLCGVLYELADRPQLSGFRQAGRIDSPQTQQEFERPLPPLPGRLGLAWDAGPAQAGRPLRVARVVRGSAAATAGIQAGDRILEFNDKTTPVGEELQSLVLAAQNPASMVVERSGAAQPLRLAVQLAGQPMRLGISWRVDPAEPRAVALSRVVPGSPAARADLRLNDRIYEVSGKSFASSEEFRGLVSDALGPLEFLVERQGRLRVVTLEPLARP